jgi:hypothetical protein
MTGVSYFIYRIDKLVYVKVGINALSQAHGSGVTDDLFYRGLIHMGACEHRDRRVAAAVWRAVYV